MYHLHCKTYPIEPQPKDDLVTETKEAIRNMDKPTCETCPFSCIEQDVLNKKYWGHCTREMKNHNIIWQANYTCKNHPDMEIYLELRSRLLKHRLSKLPIEE